MSGIKLPVRLNADCFIVDRDGTPPDIHEIVAALNAAPQWRPIETAPKDGTVMLLCHHNEGRVVVGAWTGFGDFPWQVFLGQGVVDDFIYDAPTHWMPLPAPPEAQGGDNG